MIVQWRDTESGARGVGQIQTPMRELLEFGFQRELERDDGLSRLTYLANHVFDFTTYDDAMSELFAKKALEVCLSINDKSTLDYIKDADNHRWYLLMVNMSFFATRLDWGSSIRGAWWALQEQTLQTSGLWHETQQLLSLKFSQGEWVNFIRALGDFCSDDGEERNTTATQAILK